MGRRAGLSDELTLKLWRRASGEAAKSCGSWKSADYYATAMARLIELVDDESGAQFPAAGPDGFLHSMWCNQQRLFELNRAAVENACRLWQSSWDGLLRARESDKK